MRAMWIHYPKDESAAGDGTQFLWGRDLLVAPVVEKGATSRSIDLPRGDWFDWWTNEKHKGGRRVERDVDLGTMPIYARSGAIIPLDPVRQFANQSVEGPTELRIYRGANGRYTLYEDDGVSLDYLEGAATWTRVSWSDGDAKLVIEPGPPNGVENLLRGPRLFRVRLVPGNVTKDVRYTGERVEVDL